MNIMDSVTYRHTHNERIKRRNMQSTAKRHDVFSETSWDRTSPDMNTMLMMSSDSPIRACEGLDLRLLTYTPPGVERHVRPGGAPA